MNPFLQRVSIFNPFLQKNSVKLSPTNYLLWHNHLLTLLTYQNYRATSTTPKSHLQKLQTLMYVAAGVSTPNHVYASQLKADQKVFLIIQSSLTEATMAETQALPQLTKSGMFLKLPIDATLKNVCIFFGTACVICKFISKLHSEFVVKDL